MLVNAQCPNIYNLLAAMVMDKLVEKDNFMSAFIEASKTFHGKESFET
jgi:hypothetical protein